MRILEWVAIYSSRESSQPRDRIQVSCIAGRFLTTREDRGSGRKRIIMRFYDIMWETFEDYKALKESFIQ